jgi:hypothetical protein
MNGATCVLHSLGDGYTQRLSMEEENTELHAFVWCAAARYHIEVQTSSCKGAGTDADVSVELVTGPVTPAAGGGGAGAGSGSSSVLGPWRLDQPGAFERGQVGGTGGKRGFGRGKAGSPALP